MKLDGQTRATLLNLALYQIGWFACVLGAAHGHGAAGAAVALALTAVHVMLSEDRSAQLRLVLGAGLFGVIVESLQLARGVLVFPSHPAEALLPPLWIVALWLQFATLFDFALSWLSRRTRLAALLGLVGGPLAFLAGERLGAAVIGDPRWQSLSILALVWAVAVPVLVALADLRPGAGRYRWAPVRSVAGESS